MEHMHNEHIMNHNSINNTTILIVHHEDPVPQGTFSSYLYMGILIFFLGFRNIYHFVHNYQATKDSKTFSRLDLNEQSKSNKCYLLRTKLDILLLILISLVGIPVEVIVNHSSSRPREYALYNLYVSFVLFGIVELLQKKGVRIPEHTSDCFEALAYLNGAFIFNALSRGHIHVFITCRMIIEYLFVGLTMAVLIQCALKQKILAGLIRPYLGVLLGAWFCQSAIVIDSPRGSWTDASHDNVMLITVVFGWHLFGSLLFVSVCVILMGKINNFNFREDLARLNQGSQKVDMASFKNSQEVSLLNKKVYHRLSNKDTNE